MAKDEAGEYGAAISRVRMGMIATFEWCRRQYLVYGHYVILSITSRFASFLTTILCIKWFDPSAFGELTYLMATVGAVAIISNCGLELATNATVSGAGGRQSAKSVAAYSGLLVLGLIILFLAPLLCLVFLSLGSFPKHQFFWVLAGVSLAAFQGYLNGMSFGMGKPVLAALAANIIGWLFALLLIAFQTSAGGLSLYKASLISQAIGAFALLVLIAWQFETVIRRLEKKQIVQALTIAGTMLKFGVKTSLVSSLIVTSQWLIQRNIAIGPGGLRENGIYGVGMQAYNLVLFVPILFGPIFLSKISVLRDGAARRKLCVRAGTFCVAVGILLCAALVLLLHVGLRYLAPFYQNAEFAVVMAGIAATIHMTKAPFSIYFQAHFRMLPEIVGSCAGVAVVLLAVFFGFGANADEGMIIRVMTHLVQLLVTLGAFAIGRPQAVPSEVSIRTVEEF